MTDHTELDAFIASLGLDYTTDFVPLSKSRNAKEKHPTINWRVAVAKGAQRIETDYSQGVGHLPHYVHQFSRLVAYDTAVRAACETGKSRLRPNQKNGYDACQEGAMIPRTEPVPRPLLRDVLYSLVLDASAVDAGSFEMWAADYGYDTDSRAAEKVYRQCLDDGLKLRAMIGNDALATLQQLFQDY
jgi:hypothetical protein